MFFCRKPTSVIEATPPKPQSPPLTSDEFINRYRRNYVNYAALIEAAFGLGDEMFAEYDRLSDADKREAVCYAKAWVQRA